MGFLETVWTFVYTFLLAPFVAIAGGLLALAMLVGITMLFVEMLNFVGKKLVKLTEK